ncbi:MAG: VOC family protein [Caulobacteraceae bacterium]
MRNLAPGRHRSARPRRLSARAAASGALAIGALAVGAAAVGALAIGRMAIGRLAIGKMRIGELEVDTLRLRAARGSANEARRPYLPEGWPTLAPRIITAEPAELAAFITHVFEAEGEIQSGRPTELRIGDSIVMVSDGGGEREAMAAFVYVYVPDVDAAFQRAKERGAEAIAQPEMTPWGDRRATVRDPWGDIWQIATRLGP